MLFLLFLLVVSCASVHVVWEQCEVYTGDSFTHYNVELIDIEVINKLVHRGDTLVANIMVRIHSDSEILRRPTIKVLSTLDGVGMNTITRNIRDQLSTPLREGDHRYRFDAHVPGFMPLGDYVIISTVEEAGKVVGCARFPMSVV